MMEMVVTTGAIIPAKLQTNHHHPTFLQAGCPSCRPTNSVKALKGQSIKWNTNHKRLWYSFFVSCDGDRL